MTDNKFITFKRPEMEKWMVDNPSPGLPSPVPDAVVIRRQDIFAAPALEAYANAIQCVIEALGRLKRGAEIRNEKLTGSKEFDWPIDFTATEMARSLRDIADYFHEQAEQSYTEQRRLPD